MSRLNNVLNLNHSVEDDKSQIHSDNSSNQESQDIVVGDYENKLRRHIDYCEAISKELQNFLKVSLVSLNTIYLMFFIFKIMCCYVHKLFLA